MRGFTIVSDYAERYGVFDHRTVVINMFTDTETVLGKITDEALGNITKCDADHPMVVSLHLSSWTSYKTIQRLYSTLSLFRDSVRDRYGINMIIDFTAVTADTLDRFGVLKDFQILSGESLDIRTIQLNK